MKFNAELDMNMVGLEATDELTVLLTLTAPQIQTEVTRAPQTVQVVLDRSGSMAGDRLDAAKEALSLLIQRLSDDDAFGLVAFDDEAKVIIPTRPMADHNRKHLSKIVDALDTGGSTDISAGFLLGLSQAKSITLPGGANLILLSDGQANEGEQNPDVLQSIASKALKASITTSTIGIGDGYSEVLLEALAAGGSGEHRFALSSDDARAAIGNEIDGLLQKAAINTVLRLTPTLAIDLKPTIQLLQRMPMWMEGETYCVQVGDLLAGEERKVVLTLSVPGMSALGLCQIADLQLTFTQLPELVEYTITQPLHVNVVPGDQLAQRKVNHTVLAERTMAIIQQEKDGAKRDLATGDYTSAATRLRRSSQEIQTLGKRMQEADAPTELVERLESEAADFAALAETVEQQSQEISTRRITESYSRGSRNRRRPDQSN